MEDQKLSQSEKRALYNAIYRIEYNEEIKNKRQVNCVCICGKEIRKRHLSDHIKSKPHQIFLQQQSLLETDASETTVESEQTTPKEKKKQKCVVVCECGCKMFNTSMPKHMKSVKHVMMMGGATEEECKRYYCGKARLTSYIQDLSSKDLEPMWFIPFAKGLEELVSEYNGYKEKYKLHDPWFENILTNTTRLDAKQKLNELRSR